MPQEKYTPTDRFEELVNIDLDSVFDVLDILCDNLLPDLETCMVYLARILQDKSANDNPRTMEILSRLLRKAVALGPLNHAGLDLAARLSNDPSMAERASKLSRFMDAPSIMDMRRVMSTLSARQRKQAHLEDILKRTPGHIVAAAQRLTLDLYDAKPPGDWIDSLVVPKFAANQWNERLFLHYTDLSLVKEALELWPAIAATGNISEIHLNRAAEMFIKSGDTERAAALYRNSLSIDPTQGPVRHRLAEIENPTRPDTALVNERDVTICLYSWNKAADLERTLASLATTDIGRARIRVLLNGCSDNSAEVTEAARKLFPNNDFDTVSLAVNVGAPAARNWLGALPEVRASEFVAYIDDDVELPADWLAHYLTIMDANPKTSAVGCKVVFGENPQMIQYLYRAFSLAVPGMIKLTDPNQIAQFDYGQYDYIRTTDTVMGCCHLLRMAHMKDGPQFDLRYSPSQVDDIAHDLKIRVDGGVVQYCGLVKCIHHQNTGGGFMRKLTEAQLGQVLGNDTKFYYFFKQYMRRIQEIMMETKADR